MVTKQLGRYPINFSTKAANFVCFGNYLTIAASKIGKSVILARIELASSASKAATLPLCYRTMMECGCPGQNRTDTSGVRFRCTAFIRQGHRQEMQSNKSLRCPDQNRTDVTGVKVRCTTIVLQGRNHCRHRTNRTLISRFVAECFSD